MSDLVIIQDAHDQNDFYVQGQSAVCLEGHPADALQQLTTEYRGVLRQAMAPSQAEQRFLEIGQRLFDWLQQRGNWGQQLLARGRASRLEFQLQPDSSGPGQIGSAIAAAPWELLADEDGFFARRLNSRFLVLRRLLSGEGAYQPSELQLSMVFMAASPHGQVELNYRSEEVAIAASAGRIGIDLTVEETGQLEQLADTLSIVKSSHGAVDVLHLSCHGLNQPGPCVALESETGEMVLVDATRLWDETKHAQYKLAFVSACHTAEATGTAPSFARQLIASGLPAAVAWDGAVLDQEAIEFAERFYQQLHRGQPLADAYLSARNALAAKDSRHWHLCRLLVAEHAQGPLATGTKSRRKAARNQAEKAFLDTKRRISIAGFEEFVGRRRELQGCIRACRNGEMLLIHGPGQMGKSSLAGRLARRLPQHRHVVCYRKECTPREMLAAIANAYQQTDVTKLVAEKTAQVHDSPSLLSEALREVIDFVESKGQPLLLILDDFEQVLQEHPPLEGLHSVDGRFVQPVAELLQAFQHHGGDSRLLITCRYEFQLPDVHQPLADALQKIQLYPFTDLDHQRQLAQLRQTIPEARSLTADQLLLLDQALGLASGDPGLLRHLVELVLTEPASAPALFSQVQDYIRQGNDPTDSRVGDYLQHLAIGAKLQALSDAEKHVLRMAKLLIVPAPRDVFASVSDDLSPGGGQEACRRLLSFGLLDRTPDPLDPLRSACSVNQLAAPQIAGPQAEDAQFFAQRLLPLLTTAWPHAACPPICDVQLCRLAGLTRDADTFRTRAETALEYLDRNSMYGLGYPLAKLAVELIERPGANCSRVMANLIRACAQSASELQQSRDLYGRALAALPEPTDAAAAIDYGALRRDQAQLSQTLGDLEAALSDLNAVKDLLAKFDLTRERAVTLGDIARIKVSRGEVDEALGLHEEMLRVFESLGDQRSRAVTLGDIARIKVSRGEVDEALGLHEEMLRVFESLGDQRSRAVTLGDIARIKVSRGEVDEALGLHEERLRVFESLGDQRERAVTLGDIARIKVDRGEVDEALGLHEERLRVFESLGDQRSRAVTLGDIARIKVSRGEVDEALGLQDECLEVNRRLGDQDGIAAAQNDRFDLLLQKERWQDALEAISESFTTLTQIGRMDGLGVVGMKFGTFLAQAGQADDARQVLGIARQAWVKLNHHPYVEQIDQLLQSIEEQEGDAQAD